LQIVGGAFLLYGWHGKAARVNLTKGKVTYFDLPKSLLLTYLGGRGLASRYLFDEVPLGVDPLSPDNKLMFSVGPLLGTIWPTASRYTVAAKSPLTNALGYAHAGGFWGAEFKKTGFDLVIVEGKSETPVYLLATDEKIEIMDAKSLWGKDTWEVTDILIEKHKSSHTRVLAIGPAGENLVKIAAVINDKGRAAARTGMAAVMGSKKLKAFVAVGSKKTQIFDEEKFRQKVKSSVKILLSNVGVQEYGTFGTSILVGFKMLRGDLPAKNHIYGNAPFGMDLTGEKIRDTILVRPQSCQSCPIHCARVVKVDDTIFEGMEYETIDAMGPMLWVDNLRDIAKFNIEANKLGLDTISLGVTISFAMELYERGIITKEDLGYALMWGDSEAVLRVMNDIAYRKGFGNILAEGSHIAAKRIGKGAEKYELTVKGVELPRQEPRATKGFGLAHAVSNRGADHLYALPTLAVAHNEKAAKILFPEEWVGELLDPKNPKYKPEMVYLSEHFCAVSDSIGVCKFSTAETWGLLPKDFAEGLTYLTGEEFTGESLMKIGERIVNLERSYNVLHGYSRKDDSLPYRVLNEPLKMFDPKSDYTQEITLPNFSGEFKPPYVELDELLDRYYELRGWTKNGTPTEEKLKELGLDFVIKRLKQK